MKAVDSLRLGFRIKPSNLAGALPWHRHPAGAIIPVMRSAAALFMLILPAVLAAKAACPKAHEMLRTDDAAYSLTANWRALPMLSDQVL